MKTAQTQFVIQLRRLFFIATILLYCCFNHLQAQPDTCKVPWIPPEYIVGEEHWDEEESFWQNGGHIPENVIDEDTTNYARAHIKASGSATIKVFDDEGSVYPAGSFAGYYIKCRAFRDADFSGVTISTYYNDVLMESYTGDDLWVEYIPDYVNDPICIGFFTTRDFNQIELHLDSEGPRVHYDVFYAVLNGICTEELPPLPVTWLSFEAQKKGEVSALKWITAQEFNNAGYEVERSTDGRLFELIGRIDPARETSSTYSYAFVDESPAPAVNHYRIKQIDHDGQVRYSEIRSVNFGTILSNVRIWPNPVSDLLTIEFDETVGGHIKIVNSSGAVVYDSEFSDHDVQANVDISSLSPGLYSVMIELPYEHHFEKIVVLR